MIFDDVYVFSLVKNGLKAPRDAQPDAVVGYNRIPEADYQRFSICRLHRHN